MLDWLVRHWHLKLLALLLAFVIWVAVTGESPIFQDLRVPLEIVLRDDCVLAETAPSEVTVRLRGTEPVLRRIDPVRLGLYVDLRDAGPGERKIQLSTENLRGVPVEVEASFPAVARLDLTIDRRMRRALPVVPSFAGRPPAGFAFYGSRVTPENLDVEGPEQEVSALQRLRTDPVHLDERTAPFTARVSAVPESAAVRVVDGRPVEVQVEVDAAPIEIRVDGVPVVFSDQVFEALAVPSTVRVVLSGPPALVRAIQPAQVRAVVNLAGLTPRAAPYPVPVRVELLDIPGPDLARIAVKSVSQTRVSIRLLNRKSSN